MDTKPKCKPWQKDMACRAIRSTLFVSFILCAGLSYGQQRMTLKAKDEPLDQVLQQVRKQTNIQFLYPPELLKKANRVTVDLTNKPVSDVLKAIFHDQSLIYEYNESDKTLLVKDKRVDSSDKKAETAGQNQVVLKGILRDEVTDSLITGASIRNNANKSSTITGRDGIFLLRASKGDVLSFSHVAYSSKQVSVDAEFLNETMLVKLKPNNKELGEVVVTGVFNLDKKTFTGATSNFTGKQIKEVSRKNVLEALAFLDPAFSITRSNNLGSDPNQPMRVQILGGSTAPGRPIQYQQQLKLEYELDPNQPLFVLDGFETDLKTIVGLDVNRIESVTLLKDAASTALYGARSANGVIVIETVKPKTGKLTVSYNLGGTYVRPVLGGYNMMNSRELLQFQELMGQNGPFGYRTGDIGGQLLAQEKHNFRNNNIANGINTFWLDAPLRNTLALNHNLSVFGGSDYFTYNIGLSRTNNPGVMKGDMNSNTQGYASLDYRKGGLSVSNKLSIGGNKGKRTPYGTFKDYVNIPAYYARYDANGIENTGLYLENDTVWTSASASASYQYVNPLYNAGLPYKNEVNSLTITNNLSANWRITPNLMFNAAFQYTQSKGTADYFLSPLHSSFANTSADLKGSYAYSTNHSTGYNANAGLTYGKVFAKNHSINLNLRGDISSSTNGGMNVDAVGFATNAEPLIYMAKSYKPDSRPGGNDGISRRLGMTGSFSYSYAQRYNFSASLNSTGTSNFGSDHLFNTNYSFGLSWNAGQESFFKDSKFAKTLNVFINYGVTGTQTSDLGDRTTYRLDPGTVSNALVISRVGNPALDRAPNYAISYGLNGALFDGKLTIGMQGYYKNTKPMIIQRPLPPSNAIATIPQNIGQFLNTGMTLSLGYDLVRSKDMNWRINHNSELFSIQEYRGLNNILDALNEEARGDKSQTFLFDRYVDGSGPNDIWAVRSMGIDPQTGAELFLDRDGKYTFFFDKNNEAKVGSKRPDLKGTFTNSIRYKRFSLSFSLQYAVNESVFNSALYNKVENISKIASENNQDKRALYLRWKNPGDNAYYLGLGQLTDGMSSRFLEKWTYVELGALNINYDFSGIYAEALKKKLGLSSLNFSLDANGLLKFESRRVERGLESPFSRSIGFSIGATF